MECPICYRVHRGCDRQDALDEVVERHVRGITDDPPVPVAEVKTRIAATCCTLHAENASSLESTEILAAAEWNLIDRLERLGERINGEGASDELRIAVANVEARLDRLARLLEEAS